MTSPGRLSVVVSRVFGMGLQLDALRFSEEEQICPVG